ncbi:MAG: thioredoxin domain-containing protein [Xanthomonadales bacterium]|nr:Thiol:disulfide interchange protein DsbD [Xanthomonadales bacterium]MCC6591747.1 thioredoxin domain-containing protein [Xanthomonadales bacterium]
MRCLLLSLLVLAAGLARPLGAADGSGIGWLRDDRAAFAQARTQGRFVLLYLEAVWCHWCHVMDQQTYADARVRKLLDAHYLTLRIDQDSRPDLANRYRDYGWPATIVFAPDGSEIVKRRGYIAPENFARLLQAIVDDPTPERGDHRDEDAPPSPTGTLPEALRTELQRRHEDSYDERLGGLDHRLKFIERDSVEWALTLAQQGDAQERARAEQTLDAALALLDPVWGGFYQYSTQGDWRHPHYEKLTTLQGEYLRIYALGCAVLGRPRFCAAAQRVRAYAHTFLRAPGGGYRASQDADVRPGEHSAAYFALDDAGRRAIGVPRVAPQVYARETGAMIEALATLSEVTGDRGALADAKAAAEWALRERRNPDASYRHDARDPGGPYLGDSLRMARALLALYRADGERRWLAESLATTRRIDALFRTRAGFASAVQGDAPIAPLPTIEEQISLARHANLLAHYSGDASLRATAEHALAWLAKEEIALAAFTEAGILQAEQELARAPLHLTVVGARDDALARALHRAAQARPGSYKRVDWWDRREGPLPNPDVRYPVLKRAAAFVCNDRQCSLPIHDPEGVAAYFE